VVRVAAAPALLPYRAGVVVHVVSAPHADSKRVMAHTCHASPHGIALNIIAQLDLISAQGRNEGAAACRSAIRSAGTRFLASAGRSDPKRLASNTCWRRMTRSHWKAS
jgi:hypothetical protein